jgi:hypothetical protein
MVRARGGFTPYETLAAFYGLRGVESCADGGARVWLVCFGADRAEIERRMATWLLGELRKLPTRSATAEESSPVRRRGLMSRLDIADVAIALLDYPNYYDLADGWCARDTATPPIALHPPTPELIELLGHLLDVARHREAFAPEGAKPEKFHLAAYIDAKAALCGKALTGKRLAKLVGVSPYSISIWRRSEEYKEWVARGIKEKCHIPHPDIPDNWISEV